VSVVIPAFNGLPYIHEAYDSIRSQTYANIEICISDGGSSDGTAQWLEQLPSDVTRVVLPVGTPPALNWTRATELAHGDFIKLLCQDDILYPDAIATQVHDLLGNPQAFLAVAQRDVISASGKRLYRNRGLSGVASGLVSGQDLLKACYLSGTNVLGEPHAILFRREALLEAMPWRAQRPYLLDLDSYAVLLDEPECQVYVRKRTIGAFRVSTSSWSTRLMASQVDQLRQWQEEYEATHNPPARYRRRASMGVNRHNLMRRLAYAWLYAKGDMG
jgi:glycosyltransferase involved in cell wall biosynthesis